MPHTLPAEIYAFLEQVALGNSEYDDISQNARALMNKYLTPEAAVTQAQREIRIDAGSDDGQNAERLLQAVVAAQHTFWDAQRELEQALDIEIDDVDDYDNQTIESLLLEKYGDHQEDEETD